MKEYLHEISIGISEKDDKKIIISVLNQPYDKCPWDMEISSCNKLWYLCKIEETRLKAKYDMGSKEQAFSTMTKRKGKFGKFGPRRTNKKDMSKIQCYGCQEYGHYKRNCHKLKDNKNNRKREETHMTQEVKEGRSSGSLL